MICSCPHIYQSIRISPFSTKLCYQIKNSIKCSTEFLVNNFYFYFKHESPNLQQCWMLTLFTRH